MTADPKVSVLVPAFNVAEILPRAIRSVLAQTIDDLELIVIDDASTDATFAVAEAAVAADSRVRALQLPQNRGPGVARSRGLAAARGEWIAILDADDRFQPDRLAHLLSTAERHGLDAVADNIQLFDPGSERVVGLAFPLAPEEVEIFDAGRFLANNIPAGRIIVGWAQPLVRRAFLQRHDLKWRDLRHAEDLVFAMEILLAGARFAITGRPGYIYTQRRGSESGAASHVSRTQRSAHEQTRALDELEDRCEATLTPPLRRRLAAMRTEIRVASHLLDIRDRLAKRRFLAAGASLLAAIASPRAFMSCLLARYGPAARRFS